MRSSRLLTLLLLLQTRERVTTAELAERLEVSRRTVLRDVEALSAAGVPVYAQRGRSGGIMLLPGARLNVSHLDPPEREALEVAGADGGHLQRLGLAEARDSAARKLAARRASVPGTPDLPPLADVVLVDGTAWFTAPRAEADGAETDVADLAATLRLRRRMRIRYRRSAETGPATLVVDPYGLVVKAGRWYLVADAEGTARLFALTRLSGAEALEAPAVLRPGRTLRTVWDELRVRTEEPGRIRVSALLRDAAVDRARRILGGRLTEVSAAQDGWCSICVQCTEVESVRQLLQFGDHIEVLAPPAARARFGALARDLARRHGAPAV